MCHEETGRDGIGSFQVTWLRLASAPSIPGNVLRRKAYDHTILRSLFLSRIVFFCKNIVDSIDVHHVRGRGLRMVMMKIMIMVMMMIIKGGNKKKN